MEPTSNILVAGGTGFIGRRLVQSLQARGDQVTVLTRDAAKVRMLFGATVGAVTLAGLEGGALSGQPDAIVNLAGESLNSGRWTAQRKRLLLHSRIDVTRALRQYCESASRRPRVLVNASAVGYYGTSLSATFTEESAPIGADFLSRITSRWEEEARATETLGLRVAVARLGVVFGDDGGALAQMVLPYRLHVGGPVGSGRQWISWIHVHDAAALLVWLLDGNHAGAFNATSPNPVTMDELGRSIAAALGRRHWLPAPAAALRLALGEKANLVLTGQRVLPKRAQAGGFIFTHADIGSALQDLLR